MMMTMMIMMTTTMMSVKVILVAVVTEPHRLLAIGSCLYIDRVAKKSV